MAVSVLTPLDEQIISDELLLPEPLPDGTRPERRIVFGGVSWERYLAFDKKLGDERPGPRLYYLDGELEITTTSNEHERIKKYIGDFLAIYFEEQGVEIIPRGQATMRLTEAGAEPDESWCIGREKDFRISCLRLRSPAEALRSCRSMSVLACPRSGCGGGTSWRYSR